MKVKKSVLTEKVMLPQEVADKLKGFVTDDVDPKADGVKAAVGQMAANAVATGAKAIDVTAAEEHAKEVADVELKFNLHPYEATAKLSEVEDALQDALETAIRDREDGIEGDYPDVLLYGLPGFAKTAQVKAFCKAHGLNLLECDAKNMDAAQIGGIPYPVENKSTGGYQQAVVTADGYWGRLDRPNSILFLDELNRANGNTIGTFLKLINEHDIPSGTGVRHIDNLLFTVIAINPASDLFPDATDLDPAVLSRSGAMIEVGPEVAHFKSYVDKAWQALLDNPYIVPEHKKIYAGQLAIADKLLGNSSFTFDNEDEVRAIYTNPKKETGFPVGNFLNYRTFVKALKNTNGTKESFLKVIKRQKFSRAKIQMFENILADYVDKPTIGNNVFQKAAGTPEMQRAANASAQASLDAIASVAASMGINL